MTNAAQLNRVITWLGGGVIAGFIVGEMSPFVLPLLVSGIAEKFQISLAQVGLITTGQLLSSTLAAFVASARIHRVNKRNVALIAAGFVAGAAAVSASTDVLQIFVASRLIGGLAEGVLLAAVIAACAASSQASRLYSTAWFGIGAMSLGMFALLPRLIEANGISIAFAVMAGLAFVLIPVLFGLPTKPAATEPMDASAAPTPSRVRSIHIATGAVVLLFYMAVNLTWFSMEEIGRVQGLTLPQVGDAIFVASLFGAFGPVLGIWIGARLGFIVPLTAAHVIVAIASVVICSIAGFGPFAVGFTIASGFFAFAISYFYALGGVIDPSGRLSGALRGVGGVGLALSPVVSASIHQLTGNVIFIGLGSVLLATTSLAILWLRVAPTLSKRVPMSIAEPTAAPEPRAG